MYRATNDDDCDDDGDDDDDANDDSNNNSKLDRDPKHDKSKTISFTIIRMKIIMKTRRTIK